MPANHFKIDLRKCWHFSISDVPIEPRNRPSKNNYNNFIISQVLIDETASNRSYGII